MLLAAVTTFGAALAPSAHAALARSAFAAARTPRTVALDGARLERTRVRAAHDPGPRHALAHLTARADAWLDQDPWTVVDSGLPPAGPRASRSGS
ncbi:hypothetical protein [Streptomyces sp. Caat 7-52]|uniref:hypothetical protein n=1 Tax=Streptomyces sp. Caat 7-52 TaxID=2949637 RepID=UPI0020363444|nr:hypothetical protein [Streptomyces sp. Caat 7-52]